MSKDDFISQLRAEDSVAIKQLLQKAFKPCASLILSNNGNRADVSDYLQEGVMVFIEQLRRPNFELNCAPVTYVYSVVRNLWLKRLNKQKKGGLSLIMDNPDYDYVVVQEDEIEEKKELETKHLLVAQVLKEKMKEDCRKVIVAFYYKKMSMQEIAAEMDYTAKFAKVKKNRCLDKFRQLVREAA
ncbi:MAG: sigma-70 family RNA polymerase sigma factor [Bacteroidota bacterium]